MERSHRRHESMHVPSLHVNSFFLHAVSSSSTCGKILAYLGHSIASEAHYT